MMDLLVTRHFHSQAVTYVVSVCSLRVMMRGTFRMKTERRLRTKYTVKIRVRIFMPEAAEYYFVGNNSEFLCSR